MNGRLAAIISQRPQAGVGRRRSDALRIEYSARRDNQSDAATSPSGRAVRTAAGDGEADVRSRLA
jgi:hypothetical protein